MKRWLFPLFVLILSKGYGQTDRELYLAWLDSMTSDTYVANEIFLDEILIGADKKHEIVSLHDRSNTDRLIEGQLGVDLMRRGNFAGEPILRGMSGDRTILTIDGMRMFSACTDKMDPVSSYVEPINMSSMKTSFGATNQLQGASTGGGIDFQLKKPVFSLDKSVTGSAGMNFETVNMGFDQQMDLNVSRQKWAWRINGTHRKAQNYTDGNGDEVRYSQYEKFNFGTSLAYRIANDQLLTFDYLGDRAMDVGYPALPMDVGFARSNMLSLSLYDANLQNVQDFEAKLYFNNVNHMMDDTQRDSVAMHMDMPGSTQTVGAFVTGRVWSAVNARFEYYRVFADAEMTMYPNNPGESAMYMETWPGVLRNAFSGALDYQFELSEKWSFSAGARGELTNSSITSEFGEQQLGVFDKTGLSPRYYWLHSYRTGLQRGIGNDISWGVDLSYGERIPTISEQFAFYIFNQADGYDYIGDPDLKKEKSLQASWNISVQKESVGFQSSVFGYRFFDYILGVYDPDLSAMTPGSLGVKWYQNIDRATMLGGEVGATYDAYEWLNVSASAEYVFASDDDGEPLPQIPPLRIKTQLLGAWKGFVFTPALSWFGRQDRTSESFNERVTPGYLLVDLDVSKTVDLGSWSVDAVLGVHNVTDVAYRSHLDVGSILRPGRNVIFKLKGSF